MNISRYGRFYGITDLKLGSSASVSFHETAIQESNSKADFQFGVIDLANGADISFYGPANASIPALVHASSISLLYSTITVYYGTKFTIDNNVTVSFDSLIWSDGNGYATMSGISPGIATKRSSGIDYGSGGAHGGVGGGAASGAAYYGGMKTYGSITNPVDFGSGGWGGPGGGAIHLVVGDTLQVIGTVSSNGGAATSGSGAGGSVWIDAPMIIGTGSITANSGTSSTDSSGTGGGGRVAIYTDNSNFGGTLQAFGSISSQVYTQGTAGTIYVENASGVNTLIVGNNQNTIADRTTPVSFPANFSLELHQLIINANADYEFSASANTTLSVVVNQVISDGYGALHIGGAALGLVTVTVNEFSTNCALVIGTSGVLRFASDTAADASVFSSNRALSGLDVYLCVLLFLW